VKRSHMPLRLPTAGGAAAPLAVQTTLSCSTLGPCTAPSTQPTRVLPTAGGAAALCPPHAAPSARMPCLATRCIGCTHGLYCRRCSSALPPPHSTLCLTHTAHALPGNSMLWPRPPAESQAVQQRMARLRPSVYPRPRADVYIR